MRTDILSAYVTIADLNEKRGAELVKELSLLVNHSPPPFAENSQSDKPDSNAQFIKCNITDWDQQVQVFEAAIANSPTKSCNIVIVNAGISWASGDTLWPLDGKQLSLT